MSEELSTHPKLHQKENSQPFPRGWKDAPGRGLPDTDGEGTRASALQQDCLGQGSSRCRTDLPVPHICQIMPHLFPSLVVILSARGNYSSQESKKQACFKPNMCCVGGESCLVILRSEKVPGPDAGSKSVQSTLHFNKLPLSWFEGHMH